MGIGINQSLCKSNRFIQIKFKEIAVSNFPFQGCGDWQFICFAGTEVARSSLWLFTQSGGKSEENSWTDKHNRPLIVIFLTDSCAQNRTTWSRVLMRSWRGWYIALNQKQLNNKKKATFNCLSPVTFLIGDIYGEGWLIHNTIVNILTIIIDESNNPLDCPIDKRN